jgi:hypothetical protein
LRRWRRGGRAEAARREDRDRQALVGDDCPARASGSDSPEPAIVRMIGAAGDAPPGAFARFRRLGHQGAGAVLSVAPATQYRRCD